MEEKTMYVCVVERMHILKKDIAPVQKMLSLLEQKGVDGFQSVAITISGYDDTVTELWETQEVREWYHKLVNKIPYLFYYIEQDAYETQQTVMLCVNDYESAYMGDRLSPEELSRRLASNEEIPKYRMKIHVHRKSYRQMCAEIRKHARKKSKLANAEYVIKQMSYHYGIEEEKE